MLGGIDRFWHRYSVTPESPDLRQLQRVAFAYSHLPYENVTKILKEVRSVGSESKLRGPDEVLEDHLRWGTGGTCFSLCNTLRELLDQSGFDCFIAMGDMHYGANIHCAIVVRFAEAKFLLDPGYLLHDPVRLPQTGSDVTHRTSMNTILLRGEAEGIVSLYTLESGQLRWRYRLRCSPVSMEEFVRHWTHSFSLNSMENVMLSRLDDSGRLYFRQDRLDLVSHSHREKRRVSASDSAELAAVFGVPADLILQAQKALAGRR